MALSPWTAIAQGVGHGEKEVRERRREDDKRADEQAMEMWKTLLEQGFTVGDPEKGSPDGTMVRVGRIGHLIPPMVTKNEMEQKKMEFEQKMMDAKMRLAEMEEGLQKQEFGVRLAEIEASAAQRVHDVDMRGLDRTIKEMDFETKKLDRNVAETKMRYDLEETKTRLDIQRVNLAIARAKLDAQNQEGTSPLKPHQQFEAERKLLELETKMNNEENAKVAASIANEYTALQQQVRPNSTWMYVVDQVTKTLKPWQTKPEVKRYELPVMVLADGSYQAITLTDVIGMLNKDLVFSVDENKDNDIAFNVKSPQGVYEFFEQIRKMEGQPWFKWLPHFSARTVQSENASPMTGVPSPSSAPSGPPKPGAGLTPEAVLSGPRPPMM